MWVEIINSMYALRSLKLCCYGNVFLQTLKLTAFSLYSGIPKRNAVSPSERRHGAATSFRNLVNFGAVTSEITFLIVCEPSYGYWAKIGLRSPFVMLAFPGALDNWNVDRLFKVAMDVYISYKFGGHLSSTSAVNAAQLCTADIDQHSGEFSWNLWNRLIDYGSEVLVKFWTGYSVKLLLINSPAVCPLSSSKFIDRQWQTHTYSKLVALPGPLK